MVKDPPFNSRDVHWIPGWRAKIPHTCRVTKPFGARGPGRSRALDPQQEKPSCMPQLSATTETLNSQKREEKQKCHLNLLTVTEGDEQHHWLNWREFEQTLGNGEGQGRVGHNWATEQQQPELGLSDRKRRLILTQSSRWSLLTVSRRNWLVIVQKRLVSDVFFFFFSQLLEKRMNRLPYYWSCQRQCLSRSRCGLCQILSNW